MSSKVYVSSSMLSSSVPNSYTGNNSSLELKIQVGIKRGFDFLAASAGLICLSPLLGATALAVMLTSRGPVFYKSLRIGQNSKPFYMYKFRTMIPNAHALRNTLNGGDQGNDNLFKMQNDPRVTPIGAFLRKYSLDEFPQLLNVIKGDMSLVGPRPYIPEESNMFKAPYTCRFDVMPGMTGPWQVSGRSNLSFQQLCNLELDYVQTWSLVQDFMILLKTIPSVVFKKGAY